MQQVLPLLVIGKAANPRCFKHVNKDSLPVDYRSQRSAWMDSDIFSDWFHKKFVPAVTKNQKEKGLSVKGVLLLDNAPSHPDAATLVSCDGNIKALYLPPNTTALFQPMDQGVIEALKRRYRKALLQKLLLEEEEGRSIIQFVKQINMKDVVYMTATAWEDLPPMTITKSWNKLLQSGDTNSSESSLSPVDSEAQDNNPTNAEVLELAHQLDSNLEDEDVCDWMNIDSGDQGYQLLTDEEIVQQVTQTNEIAEEEEDEQCENEDVPSSREVTDMLDKCLLWYERQGECTPTSLMLLKRVRDLAATKRFANLKQLKLDLFFS